MLTESALTDAIEPWISSAACPSSRSSVVFRQWCLFRWPPVAVSTRSKCNRRRPRPSRSAPSLKSWPAILALGTSWAPTWRTKPGDQESRGRAPSDRFGARHKAQPDHHPAASRPGLYVHREPRVFRVVPGTGEKTDRKRRSVSSAETSIELQVEDVDLADYVAAGSMSITTESTGRRPEQDTTVRATIELLVDINICGE